MTRRTRQSFFGALLCAGFWSGGAAPAQIVPDGSLSGGNTSPRIGPDYIIPASLGRVQGGNLFHSFGQFQIHAGESATFTGPGDATVGNVIARVTGGTASEINGLLRVAIPGANLYFVNPAGVTIGPNASIDVPGAVVIATADTIRFADGALLPTGTATAADVLSTAPPAAYGFLTNGPGRIDYNGNGDLTAGLVAADGQVVSLVGGAVRISGGRILASKGRVNIVSAAGAGEVAVDATSLTTDVSTGATPLGPIELLNGSALQGPAGGRVQLKGDAITVDHSVINTDNSDTPGGGIEIEASGAIAVTNAGISSNNFGDEAGGSIQMRAGTTLTIRGLSDAGAAPVTTDVSFNGPGGNITLEAADVAISENGAVTSFVNQNVSGRGGDIAVKASNSITIDGSASQFLTGLAAETFNGSFGDAGNISIEAPRVTFVERAEMTSTTRGAGNAGKLMVNAPVQFLIDGRNAVSQNPVDQGAPVITGLQSRVGFVGGAGATGAGGTIDVTTGSLVIRDGGVLSATTFGRGPGGAVNVNAGTVDISGTLPDRFTGIFARTQLPTVGGPGGDLSVNAQTVGVSGSAEISSASTGSGTAGELNVTAGKSLTLTKGGSVNVSAGFFDARDRFDDVPAGQDQPADAGTLTITAPEVQLRDSGLISARATRTSGRVKIDASDMVRLVGGTITAEGATAGSGIIDIDPQFVLLDHSTINGLANGNDVPVQISADVFLTSESQILSDAAVLPPEVDIAGSLVRLNAGLASDAARLAEVCGLRAGGNVSSFVATGRGGTPLQPGGFEPVLVIRGAK